MSERLPERFTCTEIAEGAALVEGLFRRKFGDAPPPDPHHLFVLYRADSGLVPVGYVHFAAFGDICLVGGACTDGTAFARMSEADREAVAALDGVYYFLLRYGFERFADRFSAFFGYCGDPRAEAVDLRAGFEQTGHERLLVHWPRPLHPVQQRALVAKAHALGPF